MLLLRGVLLLPLLPVKDLPLPSARRVGVQLLRLLRRLLVLLRVPRSLLLHRLPIVVASMGSAAAVSAVVATAAAAAVRVSLPGFFRAAATRSRCLYG